VELRLGDDLPVEEEGEEVDGREDRVRAGATDGLPLAVRGEPWARGAVLSYDLRWIPQDQADAYAEVVSRSRRRERQTARDLVEELATVLVTAVSGVAVDDDGCFTGEITHFNQAQGKADACEALARSRGWDLSECSAYSDSVSDAPPLRLVGHPYAVNPDRGLREMAQREGWPTLTFSSTVRVLPREVPTPAKVAVPFIAGVAVGAAACALLRR